MDIEIREGERRGIEREREKRHRKRGGLPGDTSLPRNRERERDLLIIQ